MSEFKKNISIFGGCVSRDIFGLHRENGGYHVVSFIQSNSPFSAVSQKNISCDLKTDDKRLADVFSGMPEFNKKMIAIDLNKNTFSYLERKKGDYLIMDATSCRHSLLRFKDEQNGNSVYVTNTDRAKINKIYNIIGGEVSAEKASLVRFENASKYEFDLCMEEFSKKILSLYDEDKIILIECYPVPFAVDENRIHAFDYNFCIGEKRGIERGFSAFCEKFSGAHIIEFPHFILGDAKHKWGANILHYIEEYYEYGLKAVDTITLGGLSRADEAEKLERLKKEYEIAVHDKYEPVFSDYITEANNIMKPGYMPQN